MQTVDYDVVSEIAGHKQNKGVEIVEAAKDIFSHVKEKGMQVAVSGNFIEFKTIEELQRKLSQAAIEGFSIRVFDENIGG